MGVNHSMDAHQVTRISNALKESATAIEGINSRFDKIEAHMEKLQGFNTKMNSRVVTTLNAFSRLDETMASRSDSVLDGLISGCGGVTQALEDMLYVLQGFDMIGEVDKLPKTIIPLTIPLLVLLVELSVANAYMGILLSSLPNIAQSYSNYLLANAGSVLLGLTLSLLWLGVYRCRLSWNTRRSWRRRKESQALHASGFSANPVVSSDIPSADPHRANCALAVANLSTEQIRAELAQRGHGTGTDIRPPQPRVASHETFPHASMAADDLSQSVEPAVQYRRASSTLRHSRIRLSATHNETATDGLSSRTPSDPSSQPQTAGSVRGKKSISWMFQGPLSINAHWTPGGSRRSGRTTAVAEPEAATSAVHAAGLNGAGVWGEGQELEGRNRGGMAQVAAGGDGGAAGAEGGGGGRRGVGGVAAGEAGAGGGG